MISMIPQSYFDKFGALRRLLGTFFKNIGPFPKNVGDFLKNVGLFLRNLPRFFFYLPRFFSPKIAMQQPPCVKVVKAKSAKSLLMCARNTRSHTHARTSQKDTQKRMTICSMRKTNKCAHFCASEGREVASFAVKLLNSATIFTATRI